MERVLIVGFVVARNTPNADAFASQHYGQPKTGANALQSEIDRALRVRRRCRACPAFRGWPRR